MSQQTFLPLSNGGEKVPNGADDSPRPMAKKVPPARETWDKKLEFLLAVIGFAVDLGNVWRFPYICYRNGGGAFLLPYFIMLLFLGLPLFYMELALGQFHRSGPISIWTHICPLFKGLGYAIGVVSVLVGSYYNTIIAWALYYFLASLRAEVPWASCNNTWNSPDCVSVSTGGNVSASNLSVSAATEYFLNSVLEADKSDGVGRLGSVKWQIVLCLLAVFVVIYFCLWKGVKSSGKAVWVTATFPYIILFVLLVRGCTLPGAGNGILYYLTPNFASLLTVEVWIDAAAQIFFSLGPGFGTLVALSSYNKFHNNCYRDAVVTSVINCGTSLLAGFAVFSVLGYMAFIQDTSVDKVAAEGPGLVFVVFPEAIATLPGSPFWAAIFFVMLITLGLDSSFGGLESVITAVCDEFPRLASRREVVVGVVVFLCFIIGIPTTTYGGQYVIQLMDIHAAPIPLIFVCFIEVISVNWFYGVQRFSEDIRSMLGFCPGVYWKVCWVFICPLSLLLLFLLSIWGYSGIEVGAYVYPWWSLVIGWLVTCSSLICIPAYCIYAVLASKGNLKQRLMKLLRPVRRTTAPEDMPLDSPS